MKYFVYLLATTTFFLTSNSAFADSKDPSDSEGNSEQIVVTGKKTAIVYCRELLYRWDKNEYIFKRGSPINYGDYTQANG